MSCQVCKTKINPLMISMYKCKCDNVYCYLHLHEHKCTFNYLEKFQKEYIKNNIKIIKPKIEII